MMQQVATAKSEVAAIAAKGKAEFQFESDSNQDFERLLQDQQANSSNNSKSNSTSFSEKSASPSSEKQGQTVNGKKSDYKSTAADTQGNDVEDKHIVEAYKKSATAIIEGQSNTDESTAVDNESDKNAAKTHTITQTTDAQEWVTLIENLQKLTDQARKSEPSNDLQNIDSVDELAVSSDSEQEQREEGDALEAIKIASSGLAVSNNNQANLDNLLAEIAQKKLDLTQLNTEDLAGNLDSVDLKQWLQDTLQDLAHNLASADADSSTDLDSMAQVKGFSENSANQVSVTELLKLSTELQDIFAKFNASNNSPLSKTKEGIANNSAVVNESVERPNTLPDLALAENQELLSALLADSETSQQQLLKVNPEDNNSGLDLDEDELSQAELLAAELLDEESQTAESTESTQLIEEDLLQQEQDISEVGFLPENTAIPVLTEASAGDKSASSTLLTLANLSANKLDKVLTNMAERLLENASSLDKVSHVQALAAESGEALNLANSTVAPIGDFVASLKAGITEFKAQLAQGREPGIDLKGLVAESFEKLTVTSPSAKVPEVSESVLNGFSQVLDFAASLSRAVEHQQNSSQGQTYTLGLRDAAQVQGEQVKQSQLSQFESKFEKAVNIAKPEGLQQLAEKVRWMTNTKNLVAEIRLDPAELGSVHVKVAVSGETASVNFVVQSQQARDAMDNATPRLREMLAEKGIELGQSSVRQESDGQQQNQDEQLAGGQNSQLLEHEEDNYLEPTDVQQKVVNGALGGIDYFV